MTTQPHRSPSSGHGPAPTSREGGEDPFLQVLRLEEELDERLARAAEEEAETLSHARARAESLARDAPEALLRALGELSARSEAQLQSRVAELSRRLSALATRFDAVSDETCATLGRWVARRAAGVEEPVPPIGRAG